MDYTQSDHYVVDVTTGHRRHDLAGAIPTAVTDKDINSIIWSLMEVVLAGGQTPAQFDPTVPSSYGKLKAALDAMYAPLGSTLTTSSFTGSNQLLASSGYQKLPGGLILQWGLTTASAGSTAAVTFPLTFPSACYGVTTGIQLVSSALTVSAVGVNFSSSGFTYFNPNTGPINTYWFAVGK